MTDEPDQTFDAQAFECPRCASQVAERFWGPCSSCRAHLVEVVRREAAQLETARFEPAVHVVPNHVATKD